jgi:hypothetical protein
VQHFGYFAGTNAPLLLLQQLQKLSPANAGWAPLGSFAAVVCVRSCFLS